MATHSSILAWKIPRTEEAGGLYSPRGCNELDMTEHTYSSWNQDCRRNINNLRYADDTTHVAESEEDRQMSRQVSRGSAGEYQADEQAGVNGSAVEYQAV